MCFTISDLLQTGQRPLEMPLYQMGLGGEPLIRHDTHPQLEGKPHRHYVSDESTYPPDLRLTNEH